MWRTFIFLDWHFCNATGRCICNTCKCMTLRCWFYFSWNLRCEALEVNCMLHVLDGSSMLHDRIKENKDNTAQWPTEPGQVTFACFVCCVKKVRARSSENLKIFSCSWPMLRNSKRPSEILMRCAALCSTEYHWRDLSVHKTTEPFNLRRAVSNGYTSESKHWPTSWNKR